MAKFDINGTQLPSSDTRELVYLFNRTFQSVRAI
jgi:hypothetical protein